MEISRTSQPQVQAAAAPQRANKVQESEPPREQPAASKKLEEPSPRPTLNTQGQTTGRLLNVKA